MKCTGYRGLLLLLAWLPSLLIAAPLELKSNTSLHNIGRHFQVLEDASGTLDINQLRDPENTLTWQHIDQPIPSFGYSASTYWLRLAVTQHTGTPQRHLFEIAYPVLDNIHVYIFEGGELSQQLHMGDSLPFDRRPIDHANFIFPVTTQDGALTELYFRIDTTSSVQLPISIYSSTDLFESKYIEGMGQALFYGAMLIMSIYNFLLFLSLRDISHFYCAMYILSMASLLATIQGLTYMYLWPDNVTLNDATLVLSLSGMIFFPALFFRSVLSLNETRPILSRVLLVFACLSILTAAGGFFLPYRLMIITTIVLVLGAITTGFSAGILRWLDGYHAAKYFNLAWFFMFSAGALLAMNKFNVLPSNWWTQNIGQIGATLMVALLSFALANRMNYDRRLREAAQQETAQAQKKLLDHQIRANEDLDRIVRQRTEELEIANARLKEMSATDGLTSLLNRRAFEEIYEREFKRAYREKSSLAILMIDLDHFKKINDQHGHPFGDRCLVSAANIIRANLRRPPDIAARYGGEEFILLLPNTDADGALCVANNILRDLASNVVREGNLALRLTASIGVISRTPDEELEREALLKMADERLYQAKANGRNRVEADLKSA